MWRPTSSGRRCSWWPARSASSRSAGSWSYRPRSLPWRIAWLNMIGSILFMASALASYVLPSSGDVIDIRVTVAGTLLGAVCFLIGAA